MVWLARGLDDKKRIYNHDNCMFKCIPMYDYDQRRSRQYQIYEETNAFLKAYFTFEYFVFFKHKNSLIIINL